MDSPDRDLPRSPITAELRSSIAALAQLDPRDPLFAAHLSLALTAISRRVDELELRVDTLAWGTEPPESHDG